MFKQKNSNICIIGGLGHIGLPLDIMFASKGLKVCLNDVNRKIATPHSKYNNLQIQKNHLVDIWQVIKTI